MTPKLIKWCAHPLRHKDCVKLGQKTTHPKGQRLVRQRLASYMCNRYRRRIGNSKIIIKESDYLCTNCYNLEYNHMARKYTYIKSEQDDDEEAFIDEIAEIDDIDDIDDIGDVYSTRTNEESFQEENEELMNLSRPDIDEHLDSKHESLTTLNEVFRLLKIEQISDRRYIGKIHDKIDNAHIILNNLRQNFLKSKSTTASINNELTSFDIKLDDCQSILNGIKQLFFLSNNEQQLQLLTIAPTHWGRKKIEYYFGCTEHQAKQAILLRDKYGVLARPLFFSGNKHIEKAVVEQVLKFYEDDKISRQSSNKKDSIKINNEEKFFRFMEMSIGEAYTIFKEEYPNTKIGRSKFYLLRPKYIRINSPIYNCLCIYHENWYLLLESWNKTYNTKWDLYQLCGLLICSSPTEQCYSQQCSICANKLPSLILLQTQPMKTNKR